MNFSSRLHTVLRDPVFAGYAVWARLHPRSLFAKYCAKARRAGLNEIYLVLSFDCDTADDIAAAPDVHRRLLDMGICASYAVPGALLLEGRDIYRQIASTGAEFLNHGGRSHTYFDADQKAYRSCFFYDQQPREVLERDIVEGDRIVKEVIGIKPDGFRTPHFGTFQNTEQLAFLHTVLGRLGYFYSTSTAPIFGFRYGPIFRHFGLVELPLSGQAHRPLSILDSWACFSAPDRQLTPDDYKTEAVAVARAVADGPALLNLYADPSHVADQPSFFEAMAALRRVAKPVSYRQLLEQMA